MSLVSRLQPERARNGTPKGGRQTCATPTSLIAAAVTVKIAVQPTRKSGKIKAEYEN